MNRYAHLWPDVAETLAEKMDALFVAAETLKPEAANMTALPGA